MEPSSSLPPVMKRTLSWGVVGVGDEVPDLFMMTIMKRRVRCSTNFFFSDVLASFYPCPETDG